MTLMSALYPQRVLIEASWINFTLQILSFRSEKGANLVQVGLKLETGHHWSHKLAIDELELVFLTELI